MRRVFSSLRPATTLAVAAFLAVSTLAVVPQALADDDLGFFESRRVQSDAEDALAAGRHEQAAELYGRLIAGTDADSGRHAAALLGAALAELGHDEGDVEAARSHLAAYLASREADQKPVAQALQLLVQRATAPPPAPPKPAPPEPAPEPEAEQQDAAAQRIAALERQLAAARAEIAEKEKVIEDLRKIVVEEGG